MTRGLQEALDVALAAKPDLLDPGELQSSFPTLIGTCIRAVNNIRLGKSSDRDLAQFIYGRQDVPRSTLQRLLTRTQRELERIAVTAPPADSDELNRLPWMSVLHLYSAGVTSYASNSDYRTRERLFSVISTARDAYMLPMAISSGVLLTLHLAQHDKPSRMVQARDSTHTTIKEFLDCWEWIAIYAELLSIVRRRYGRSGRSARILEIKARLDDLIASQMNTLAPQAQMVAALCAYMVGQLEDNALTIVDWAEVYARAAATVDCTSKLYQRTSRRMFLRAYMVSRDYASATLLIEKILNEDFTKPHSRTSPEYATYIVWLSRGLLSMGRIDEALSYLDRMDSALMKVAPDNVRSIAILYRSVAATLSGDTSRVFDRRLLRIAMQRNESSTRRAAQLNLRLGALVALLIHLYLSGANKEATTQEVARKLLLMANLHVQVRQCTRTNAFIRIVAIMEDVDHVSVANPQRSDALIRQMNTLSGIEPNFDLEVVRYEGVLNRIYGNRIRELSASKINKRRPKT